MTGALHELYGCSLSYVALQEAFFSRRQREGETLLEFSLSLMGLREKVKQQSSTAMLNAEVLLRDQFVEFVLYPALRRELKQLVRRQPLCTFLDVCSEAIWGGGRYARGSEASKSVTSSNIWASVRGAREVESGC